MMEITEREPEREESTGSAWPAVLLVGLMLWIFLPWLIGAVDLMSWVLTGGQVSPIPWGNNLRTGVAIFWPVGWLAVTSTVAGLSG